jgi:lipid A 3-O-deacylase
LTLRPASTKRDLRVKFFNEVTTMGPWATRLGCTIVVLCCASISAAAMGVSSLPAPRGLSALAPGVTGEDPLIGANPAFVEFRAGALFGIDGPNGDKEGTPDVNLELLYGPIGGEYQNGFLNHFLRPRLHIGGTINTEGNTSELYAGFTWDVFLTQRLFIEGSFGGAVHDGDDTYFGCTANFHESGSVGFMLSERWDVMATVDHMSNANLCDANRGLTNVGFRIGRRW